MGISSALRILATKELNHSSVNHHDFKSHHLQELTYIWNLGIVNSCTQHRRKLTRVLFAVWASNGAFCCHDMISPIPELECYSATVATVGWTETTQL